MNLSISNKTNNLDMSIWEKLFIENYYSNGRSIPSKTKDKKKTDVIREDITKELQGLYSLKKEDFVIDYNSQEVARAQDNDEVVMIVRGEASYEDLSNSNKEDCLKERAKIYTDQNYKQYSSIVEILKNEVYEPAFKCLILIETLSKIYKRECNESGKSQTIVNKRDIHSSIAGHMVINSVTLEHIYSEVEINVNDGRNRRFEDIYFEALDKYNAKISKKSEVSLENVETYGKGKWIKFNGKASDPERYHENVNALTALVQNTPWCTKTDAYRQLGEGDFYVFVDNDNKPHIAVKMMGDKIDELRGISHGDSQELEEEYRDVAISFLENNKDIPNGIDWLEKEEWNKRLIKYAQKLEVHTFGIEDVEPLLKDTFFREDYRNHSGKENSNITRLKWMLYLGKETFKDYFKCEEDEIIFGDAYRGDFKYYPNVKIVLGNVSIRNNIPESLDTIYGNLEVSDNSVGLKNIRNVYGRSGIRINYSDLQDINGLENFSGEIVLHRTTLKTLNNPNVKLVIIEDLSRIGKIEKIKHLDYFYCDTSEIGDFGDLTSVNNLSLRFSPYYNPKDHPETAEVDPSSVSDLGNICDVQRLELLACPNIKSLGDKIKNLERLEVVDYLEDTGALEECGTLILGYGTPITKSKLRKVEYLDLGKNYGIFKVMDNLEYIGEVVFPRLTEEAVIYTDTISFYPKYDIESVRERIAIHERLKQEKIDEDTIDTEKIGKATIMQQLDSKGKKIIETALDLLRKIRKSVFGDR